MALTANPKSALPSDPSWDETIVPSLRKRLETESRILTKRLSTISISDEGPPLAAQRTTSPYDNVDAGLQRPSAIPRPSYSSRPAASPSPPPPPPEPPRKAAPSKRQRTRSTPFPFNNSAPPPANGHINGATSPSPSTSGSTSSRVQSPPLGRVGPSRIPTVSMRVRSGSQSSQSVGAKSSLPPSHKLTSSETPPLEAQESVSPAQSLRGNASSSSLARQRIIDERPPFTNEPPPNVLEHEFTGRPSAEEERTFQHWYRGDVSRNGGVGEYRVGKRMEMLDIANYGHALRGPAGRTRAHEEPILRYEDPSVGPRKRAESISSRGRASIYIDPQDDDVTDRVLDEMPLTDLDADETDYDQDQFSYGYEMPSEFGMQQHKTQQKPNGVVQTLPTNHDRGYSEADDRASLPMRPPLLKPQTRIPQVQTHPQSRKASASSAPIASSAPPTPAKPNPRERGRSGVTARSRSKPAAKPNSQKRSKSAGDALRSAHDKRESADYAGLADAVPDTSSPKPGDGNWDEVILPTVARRMGIEYEKEIPVTAAMKKARESRTAPAPGTFGYDYTKYKPPQPYQEIPMDEFGQQRPELAPNYFAADGAALPPAEQTSPVAPPSTTLRSRRETMPSPAPFSHYITNAGPDPMSDGYRQRRERQDVPQILVHAPTMEDRPPVLVEDGGNSGCCKCVVM